MPTYQFYCQDCQQEVTLVMTFKEREAGEFACPKCKGKNLESILSSFFAKTARKS